jgi:hypothetical protein
MNLKSQEQSEQPPVLGSWKRLYSLVILNLAFWLLIFYLFRRVFE